MNIVFLLCVFILGTLIGSFINVLALRYKTGLSPMSGRSICFHCGKTLRWYELVPIVSFVFLKGKCSGCKSKISWQYPLIEFLTGLLFVGIVLRQMYYFPLYNALGNGLLISILFCIYYAVVFSILLIITVYDIRHSIIPDTFVYTFIVLALFKLFLFITLKGFVLNTADMFDVLSPLILFVPFAFLWFVSGGKWIGLGDGKLAFGIGALLGLVCGVSAIVLGFWIGAVFSLCVIGYERWISKKSDVTFSSEIPFAPFLILGTLIVFFSHIDVFGLKTLLQLL